MIQYHSSVCCTCLDKCTFILIDVKMLKDYYYYYYFVNKTLSNNKLILNYEKKIYMMEFLPLYLILIFRSQFLILHI
jgi:hypothetical protein